MSENNLFERYTLHLNPPCSLDLNVKSFTNFVLNSVSYFMQRLSCIYMDELKFILQLQKFLPCFLENYLGFIHRPLWTPFIDPL
ncbi:hypothetical protein D3C73_1218750 [compost metagenome]